MGQQISIPLIVTLIALLALAGVQWPEKKAPTAKAAAANTTTLPPDLPTQSQLLQFSLPPIEEFSETLARPLFYEARQPPDPSAANGSNPQAQFESISSENLILSAIVLSSEEQFVLVQDPSNQRLTRVEKGQEVGGWSLDDIRNDSVLLRKDNQTKVVSLWQFEPPPKQAATHRTRKTPNQTAQQRRRQALSRIQRRALRDEANE
ncbi:MAG: hypothetical protein WAN46_06880 [Gammaproteobacteria bacterium]|jgi:general secretion pathway protein N